MNRRLRRQASRMQGGAAQSQAAQPLAMLQKVQEELETVTVEGSAGGGVVRVVATGRQKVQSVEIDPEAVEDLELLQDLVTAAVNDALEKSQEMATEKLSVVTGGMNFGGVNLADMI